MIAESHTELFDNATQAQYVASKCVEMGLKFTSWSILQWPRGLYFAIAVAADAKETLDWVAEGARRIEP